MDSEAYKALSPAAVCIFPEMKRAHHGLADNQFNLPYSEIRKRRPLSLAKISQAILELETFGFIDCPVKGGLHGQPNVYSLSDRWKQISRDPELLVQARRKVGNWTDEQRRRTQHAFKRELAEVKTNNPSAQHTEERKAKPQRRGVLG